MKEKITEEMMRHIPADVSILQLKDGQLSLLCGTDIPGTILPQDKAALIHHMNTKDAFELRIRLNLCWYAYKAECVKDETGITAYGILQDIDDFMKTEKHLSEESELIKDILKNSRSIYFSYDSRTKTAENIILPYDLHTLPSRMENFPESVIGDLSERDAESLRNAVKQIDEGEKEAECIIRMTSGWYRVHLINFFDEAGRIERTAGYAERCDRYMEAQAKLAEEKLARDTLRGTVLSASCFNATKDASVNVDTADTIAYEGAFDQDVYLEAVEAMPELNRQNPATLQVLLSAAEQIPDKNERLAFIRLLSNKGQRDLYASGKERAGVEYTRRTSEGLLRCRTEVRTVEDPETGDILAFVYTKDISDQKKDEKILHLLLEQANDWAAVIDTEDHTVSFRYMSENIRSLTGEWNLEGKTAYEAGMEASIAALTKPEDHEHIRTVTSIPYLVSMMEQNDGRHANAYEIDLPGGIVLYKQVQYCWLDDRHKEILAVQSDVTAAREKDMVQMQALKDAAEAAEKASSAKTDFLSRMSHDIRTPLNAILGFSNILTKEYDQPEQVKGNANKILTASKQLLVLINDVLDMSRIESGKVQVKESAFTISDVVSEADGVIRPLAKKKNQTFEITTGVLKHESLIADETRLLQILNNLLSNAVKYTQENGEIRLHVQSLPANSARYDLISFTVEDNGRGMSESFQKTIFEPFTREQLEGQERVQGTGLGMAIAKNLVTIMGGTISLESKLGKGSTFTVTIPMRIPETDSDREFWKAHSDLKILSVDNNPDNCARMIASAEAAGLKMDCAFSGEETLEKIQNEDYGLVILDRNMPDLNGIETAEKIREINREIKIILLTYDSSDIETEARNAGIDGFMAKPFFLSGLRKALEEDKPEVQEEETKLSGLRVLCAEDNELNAEIMKRMLEDAGAEIDIAPNGKEALRMFEEKKYDIILMDVQMPVMNGIECTKEIRKADTSIPIFALTANAFAEDTQKVLAAGMNAHIAKPVDASLLLQKIREFTS